MQQIDGNLGHRVGGVGRRHGHRVARPRQHVVQRQQRRAKRRRSERTGNLRVRKVVLKTKPVETATPSSAAGDDRPISVLLTSAKSTEMKTKYCMMGWILRVGVCWSRDTFVRMTAESI